MGLKFVIPSGGLSGSIDQLLNLDLITKSATKTISQSRYDKFCNEYIFQALKTGDNFGLAFCKKFKIVDYILLRTPNINDAKRYIATTQYVRPKVIK